MVHLVILGLDDLVLMLVMLCFFAEQLGNLHLQLMSLVLRLGKLVHQLPVQLWQFLASFLQIVVFFNSCS